MMRTPAPQSAPQSAAQAAAAVAAINHAQAVGGGLPLHTPPLSGNNSANNNNGVSSINTSNLNSTSTYSTATGSSAASSPRKGSAGVKGSHTRWLSRGRVNSFHKAAGMEASETVPGGYADDAVVLTRHSKPDPQAFLPLSSTIVLRIVMLANLAFSVLYLYWRAKNTILDIDS
jgi:hypothetical protein